MSNSSPSVDRSLPLVKRLQDDARLVRTYLRKDLSGEFNQLLDRLDVVDSLLRTHGSLPLAEAKVFEIGFGARPYNLRALSARGADVYGVDAEAPMVQGSLRELAVIARENGWERFVKSSVRHVLFDNSSNQAFVRALSARGLHERPVTTDRFLVSNAATVTPPSPFDLIYSNNVFEHIDRSSLHALVPRMAGWLKPTGLAIIVPDVFTGYWGGHNRDPRAEPWEHLRTNRFGANTSLNEMTRAEYSALFSESFDILDVIDPPRDPRPVAALTPALREELSAYDDRDLLDENPMFVLRAK